MCNIVCHTLNLSIENMEVKGGLFILVGTAEFTFEKADALFLVNVIK